ncbi:MAG: hypothetical protein U0704_06105 [Candidatus Eisenbacteria bacterium]
MVLGRKRIGLLAVLTAASVSLSSEAGAVGAFGPSTSAAPETFPASCAVQASMLEWLGVPSLQDEWTACVESGGRMRLHGRHGLKLEPLSARATDAGIWYAMPADSGGGAGATGLIAWRDVRGVDVWKNEPATFSITMIGFVASAVGGVVIAEAITEDPHSIAELPMHAAIVLVKSLPFSLVGGLAAHAIDPKPLGHWVGCDDARSRER